ncbi:MAG: flagellar biosynthesis protein FlhA [Gammaproteobacteria bacterium]|nr:flagellar biosynthesis protein FlhA [Gammaproteobacteria bacterium]
MSDLRRLARNFEFGSLAIPGAVLLVLALLVLPMPAFMLDILFTFNIVMALLIIMVAINSASPMDFSSFPVIILFATTMRLGLNVASTRVVLLEGHNGGDAAGKVIEAFGQFVIGSNYAVGFIVFAILIIINFVVITKGAGRVSEVIARFTLDALPGKQMAIDADLNAGVIDQETARERRALVSQESDFFGSMDGASKFVRGDAIAGILILLINLLGGLAIGTLQHDLSVEEATRAYVLLTIGDGLVAQVPALILSLATAIIVSRVSTSESAPEQATKQLGNSLAFAVAGGTLTILGLIPGMPNAVFLSLGIAAIGVSYLIKRAKDKHSEIQSLDLEVEPADSQSMLEVDWDDAPQVDVIGIELGYGLIPLIESQNDYEGRLLDRTKGIRKKISSELGFLLPTIRIRDNLDQPPNSYRIMLNGSARGVGQIELRKELAINPGQVIEEIEGATTQEPAFGLPAVWIDPEMKEYAQAVGYTVVDPSTVIATHLNQVLQSNADELLTFEIAQEMLDRISEQSPKLVEDLIPEQLPLSSFVKILQNLLGEGVPLRDMRSILETISESTTLSKDPSTLTALVRSRLGRLIVQQLNDGDSELEVMTLQPELEQLLCNLVSAAPSSDDVALEPGLSGSLFAAINDSVDAMEAEDRVAILVVSPLIRSWLAKLLRRTTKRITVLSYRELPDDQSVSIVKSIEVSERANNGEDE